MRKAVFVLVVTLVVSLTLFFAYPVNAEVRGVTSDSLKLGIIADMTGLIPDTWGPVTDAIKTYSRYLNDQGGVHGRKIKIIVEDDRFTIPLALGAFKKLLYRDKILALVGASGQGQTYAVIPQVEKEKVPLLAVVADPKYIIPPRRYIFGILPFYSDQVKIFFEYLSKDIKVKNPKIAFLYMDSASSKPLVPLVRKLANEYGASLVEIIIPIAGGLDMTSEVLRLKKENPDYILINGYISNTASVLKAAKNFKFERPFTVTQYGAADTTIELAKGAAAGLMGINCFGSYKDDSPGMKKAREIKEKYDPGSGHQGSDYVQGWFIGLLIEEGLKRAGRNLNGETLIQGLESINLDTKGVCGIVNCSPTNHKTIEYHRILKANIEKAIFVPITGWRKAKE